MDLSTRAKRLWRDIRLVLYYCSPCFISLGIVIATNWQRVRHVEQVVVRQVCQQFDQNAATASGPSLQPQLQKIIDVIKANGGSSCHQNSSLPGTNLTVPQYIHSYFPTAWSANSAVIAILTLLPFGILGIGLALKHHSQVSDQTSKKVLQVGEKTQYLSFRSIAFNGFVLKCIVSFIIAFGWLYIFNPHGQAASAINDWLRNTDIISADTTPNFFNFKDSPLKHALTAVFGWYLYLLGYFFYRFYKSDVLGTRVYYVLFKKFLFVIGVAFIMSAIGATSNESLLLILLMGFFPLSAVTLLTEFANKRLSMGEDQTSLSLLPGLSTWQIFRLEEEGIDSLSSLAHSDAAALKQVISSEVIGPKMLEVWIDQAQLIAILGTKRWTDLNGICESASEFLNRAKSNDSWFVAKLGEKNIYNANEIADTLQKVFGCKETTEDLVGLESANSIYANMTGPVKN